MNRDFLSNIFLLIVINLLIKPIYIFGIDRTVQNVVGLDAYGTYFEILGFALIFNILNDLGVQNFTSRNIAQHEHLIHKYFPNLLTLKLLAGLIYLIVVLAVGWYFDYTRLHFWLIFVLLCNQIIIGFVQFFRANIIGLGQYRTDSLLSALDRFLMVLICGALLLTPSTRENFQIEHFLYAHSCSLILTLLVSFFLLRKHLHQLQFRFNSRLALVLIKQSFPYALIILLTTVYNRTDALMIGQLYETGSHEVGIYANAYRLLEAAMMFALLFGNLLLPMFSRMLKAGQSIDSLIQTSFQLLSAGAITGGIAVIAFRDEIMALLYENNLTYSGDLLGLLMLGFIAVSGTFIWGSLLIAAGELRKLNMIFIGGILINIFFNFLLIPKHGALGAGFTTAVTQSVVLIAEIIVACRLLNVKTSQSVWRIALFAFLLGGFVYMQPSLSDKWWFDFGIILLVGGVFAFLTRLIQVSAIQNIVRE